MMRVEIILIAALLFSFFPEGGGMIGVEQASIIDNLILEGTMLKNSGKGSEPLGIVAIVDTILAILVAEGIARFATLKPREVGVHPCNRYGFGVSWTVFHKLLSKIKRLGFSWFACSGAVCIEDDDAQTIATYTVKLQQTSAGFGKSTHNQIRYGSLGSGHLNQGLLAICDEVECEYENISVGGKMNKAKIGVDPNFKAAIEDGLKWLVIDKSVGKRFPQLPNLVQRARNAIVQVSHGEDMFQLLLEIQNIASEMESKSDDPLDWSVVKTIVLQSEPVGADDIPTLCLFVQKYGGGTSGKFLHEIKDYAAACMPAGVKISPSYLQSIVDLKLEEEEMCPDLVVALVQAQSCDLKVVDGFSRLITGGDIRRLGTDLKGDMIECNKLLAQLKLAIDDLGMQPRRSIALKGKAGSTIARAMFGKAMAAEYTGYDYESLMHIVFEEAQSFSCADSQPVNLFKLTPKEDATCCEETKAVDATQTRGNTGLVQYDTDGKATGQKKILLAASGFKVGASVVVAEGENNEGDR